ncbi:MAG TPA: GNAT family N-acetyltransferase [Actinocrinis sp.]|uniref:GNAT family N-acetyltransferase n=1 Tax=Actinocrinis sp. TaxID=1920516 RepID=UPI002D54BD9F|nr:GNAT family N-acetyltransferase [Actinocrinis sp.]HZU58971.1 GNAT family N-acetyltransferase [Actinocrinis sp.]
MRGLFAPTCAPRQWRVTALELGPGGLPAAELSWLLACQNAADLADRPGEPPASPAELRGLLVPPYRGRRMLFAATDEAGGAAGWARLGLYEAFHRELAHAAITVHPSARRCGVGSALLDALTEAARALNRSRLVLDAPRTRASEAFAARHGLFIAGRDLRSRLDLRGIELRRGASHERVTAIVQAVESPQHSRSRHARPAPDDGFVPLHWKSRCPDDFLAGYVKALDCLHASPTTAVPMPAGAAVPAASKVSAVSTMSAGPGGPAAEPTPSPTPFSPFTSAEVRHREEAAMLAGLREYTACLIDRATGRIAALSSAHTADGLRGEQNETVVVPEYRGRGLAVRVKAQLIRELLAAEPSLTMLDTYNAVDNHRMLAVNRRLGFRPIDTHAAWTLNL